MIVFNPFTGNFDIVGSGATANLHSPGPIGDDTPDEITGTVITATSQFVAPAGAVNLPPIKIGTAGGFYDDGTGIAYTDGSIEYWRFSQFSLSQLAGPANSGAINFIAAGIEANSSYIQWYFSFNVLRTTATLTTVGAPLGLKNYIVATLPSASSVGAGAVAFVTDSSTTFLLGIGMQVTGGGSNGVPVYSDGTYWIIG